MYSSVDYGGHDLPASSTMDGINYLVGTTRLRQLRVNKGTEANRNVKNNLIVILKKFFR